MRAERLSASVHAPPTGVRALEGDCEGALVVLLASCRAQALAEGRAEAEREAQSDLLRELAAAIERLGAAREQAGAQVIEVATALAVEIARTVLRTEVGRGHYDIERIVRETLSHSGVGRGACVVHLNPGDAAALADVRFRAGTTIEADEAVARGDVHVTTPRGLLVREIDEIVRAIAERLRGDPP